MSFKKILVAIDHPRRTATVFEQAVHLAKQESANLMIFHCVDADTRAEFVTPITPNVGLDPLGSGLGVGSLQPLQQAFQQESLQVEAEQVQKWLQAHHQQATSLGISAQVDYRVGNPGTQICELAQNWGADLIILGRRGLKGLTEFLEGSVSNYVVHHAPCSVLIVQGEETATAASH